MKLEEMFSKQASFIKLNEFENELMTMRQLQTLPPEIQEKRRQWYMDWLNELEKPIGLVQSAEESAKLREEGNKLFTRKPRKVEDLLTACQIYTKAIFKAPPPPPVQDGKSETLALAYANRAMALQEFGYYAQAYDDCQTALEYGYPQQNLHKIVTRQAFCALQLKNIPDLRRHLDILETMQLNANFQMQLAKIKSGWELLQQTNDSTQKISDDELDMELDMESQEIINSKGPRGRYMVAANPIKEGEVIFSERSPAFVPVGDNLVCQQCCSLLLVPYPCPFCNLQVVYCSVKCRLMHATVHAHECMANQRDLFSHLGIAHLAFRMVITGLPQVIPFLAQKENFLEIWQSLTAIDDGVLQLFPIQYLSSLRMITHLDKMSNDDILWFALASELLVIYLQEFTVFFDVLKEVKAPKSDWELVAAALILRHIGQLVVNAHTSVSLVVQRADMPYDPLYLPIFDNTIWLRPHRVQRGRLHKFSDYDEIAAISFPYLSICNHACEASFQPRFSGVYVTTYATRDIAKGEEIFNCYTMDYRKTKKSMRQKALTGIYKFNCECYKCKRENPDQDYQQFHRYRCENAGCNQIFVPDLPDLCTLNWWDSVQGLPPGEYIKCSFCKAPQYCKRFSEFNELLKTDAVATDRKSLFKCFDSLSEWLLDYHEIKLMSAFQLVSDCFAAHNAGSPLTDAEFEKLGEVLKFYLNGIAAQTRTNAIEYVVKMTFLWDFIALGKYKCTKQEMDDMLKGIEIISNEFKTVFMNYYEDYIKELLK